MRQSCSLYWPQVGEDFDRDFLHTQLAPKPFLQLHQWYQAASKACQMVLGIIWSLLVAVVYSAAPNSIFEALNRFRNTLSIEESVLSIILWKI